MTSISELNPNSPLRQRMIEDMTLRKLAPKTQSGFFIQYQSLMVLDSESVKLLL